MNHKNMFFITGPIGSVKSSNQSFFNTLKAYLDEGYNVYHFAFYSKNNKKYDNSYFDNYDNYKFIGISSFLDSFRNLKKLIKIKKQNNKQYKIPEPNQIVMPESEVNKFHFIFSKLYTLFETIRVILYSIFIKPDIIYSYEVFSVKTGKIISNLYKIPFVKRFQGTFIDYKNIESKRTKFHKKAYKIKSDLVVIANDGTKGDKVLKKLGFKNEQILFILNGLDERIKKEVESNQIETLRNKITNNKDYFIMGIFNRFYPFKRIDRAIYLLKQAIDEKLNPLLLIGGLGGPTQESVKRYAKNLQVDNNIIWLGQIKYEKMIEYYSICDTVLILNDYANTGNQVIETAYLNIPTIATDDENNSEILNYKNMYYIKPENFSEEAILKLKEIKNNLLYNLSREKNEQILFWNERMKIEIEKVNTLIKK